MMGKAHLLTLHLIVKERSKNNREKNKKDRRKSVEKDSKPDHNRICKLRFKHIWQRKA